MQPTRAPWWHASCGCAAVAEWSVPLDVLAARYRQRFEDVVRMATVELFSRVVLRSPVDTGRFRANWFIGYGEPDVTTTKAADLDGSMKTHQIRTALATSAGRVSSGMPTSAYQRP